MKGIVFNEFIDFVESAHGIVAVDEMITTVNPASGGAYTAAGYYDFQELVAMVVALSNRCGTPVAALVRGFGQHLFGRLIGMRSDLLKTMPDVRTFLESIEGQIHVEVRRIYPDAYWVGALDVIETYKSKKGCCSTCCQRNVGTEQAPIIVSFR